MIEHKLCDRRTFLAAAAGGIAAQVSSTPSQRDFSRQDPIQYPDPDVVALDNRFRRYIVGSIEDSSGMPQV